LEAVTPATLSHFRLTAEQLIAERNVVDLLSAALAVVSGNTDIKQRSILSSREVISVWQRLRIFPNTCWKSSSWLHGTVGRTPVFDRQISLSHAQLVADG